MHIRCNPYLPQLTLPYKSLGKCSIFKVVAKEATSVELSNRKKKSITLHNFFFMHTVDFANSQRGNVCFFLCLLYLFFSFLWSSYVLFFRYFILLYLFSSLLTNIFSFCILICAFYYLLFSDLFCQLSGFCSNSISLLSFVLYLYFLLDYRFLLVIDPIYSIFFLRLIFRSICIIYTVWPDVAKFRHFDNNWQGFGFCLKIYFAMGKIWTHFSKLCMLLGKFSLL